MRVSRGASRTKSLRMSSAVKNSVAVIRDSGDPYATETFMGLFAQGARQQPTSADVVFPPVFGTLAPRRPPRR